IDEKKLSLKDRFLLAKTYQTVISVTKYIENFQPNNALNSIVRLGNVIEDYTEGKINKQVFGEAVRNLILILSPFAPHISEELWSELGNKKFVSLEKWPVVSEEKIDKKIIELDNLFQKTVEDISNVIKITGKKKNAYLYFVTDKELDYFRESKVHLEEKLEMKIHEFKVSDSEKYDPQNKSSKAKFGKPGIFLE
ncbi:MAG: class I tRNA ligase family protein, partial [Candidatus Aenigmatarchaeota archaeon]